MMEGKVIVQRPEPPDRAGKGQMCKPGRLPFQMWADNVRTEQPATRDLNHLLQGLTELELLDRPGNGMVEGGYG